MTATELRDEVPLKAAAIMQAVTDRCATPADAVGELAVIAAALTSAVKAEREWGKGEVRALTPAGVSQAKFTIPNREPA